VSAVSSTPILVTLSFEKDCAEGNMSSSDSASSCVPDDAGPYTQKVHAREPGHFGGTCRQQQVGLQKWLCLAHEDPCCDAEVFPIRQYTRQDFHSVRCSFTKVPSNCKCGLLRVLRRSAISGVSDQTSRSDFTLQLGRHSVTQPFKAV
jgi:hypothetical protein